MRLKKWGWVSVLAGGCVLLAALAPVENEEEARFHTERELREFREHRLMYEIDSTILFPTGKVCGGCHGYDPQGNAFIDADGEDINIYDDWRSTLMANSAKDPFWRATVSHEVLVNPAHQLELETKCTSCHAPAGNHTAIMRGAAYYTVAEMLEDTIAMDGVNCMVCHSQSETNLGQQFSGAMTFDTTRVSYGPYAKPFLGPMQIFIGVTPVYSEHINNAGICAGCHTLVTNSVDLEGQLTGTTFVEQATYHEWLNSEFSAADGGVTCQGCHIPRTNDPVVISANYAFLQPRTPFGMHHLVGANTLMLNIMRNNIDDLGILATQENFDSTIALTTRMLQQQTLDVTAEVEEITLDTAFVGIKLKNKAGHKFPSGYPSRRAVLSVVVTSEAGDTLFHSGKFDENYEVFGHDPQFEPHYQVINSPQQVQIYEMVQGDVNGQFTTVLERAYMHLKDNRLVPSGFSTLHSAYDTTEIVGAELDPDFNHGPTGAEGTGTDIVHYHIPLNGYVGTFRVEANVYYQSMPPKWMAPIFAANTPEITTFKTMFDAADRSPVFVGGTSIDDLFISSTSVTPRGAGINVSPNPTADGVVRIGIPSGTTLRGVKIYAPDGRLVGEEKGAAAECHLPAQKGLYLVVLDTSAGQVVRKVLRM